MVMACHYSHFIKNSQQYLNFGMTGVTLFFVISGFVFSKSINSSFSVYPYLVRRFFRIYPLYLFSLIFYYLYTNSPSIFLKNLIFLKHLFFLQTTNSIEEAYFFNAPYWTLPIEVEFYLIVPILSFLKKRIENCILFLLIIFLGVRIYLNINSSFPLDLNIYSIIAFHIPGFLFEFLVGILCYQMYKKRESLSFKKTNILLITGLFILISLFIIDIYGLRSVFVIIKLLYSPICAVGYAFVFFSLLFLIDNKSSICNKCCIFCGQISYGVYLFHILTLKVIDLDIFSIKGINAFIIYSLITILISYLLHIFIENPMRALGRKLSCNLSMKKVFL